MAGNEERRPVGRYPRRGESFFGGEYVEGESSATATARNKALRERGSQSNQVTEQPPRLLFRKKLDENDTSRLVLDAASFGGMMGFLTDIERDKVLSGDDFLKVETEDPWGEPFELHLRRCSVENTYGFGNKWNDIVNASGLEKGDLVKVWGRRVGADNELRLKVEIEQLAAGYDGDVEEMAVDSNLVSVTIQSECVPKEGDSMVVDVETSASADARMDDTQIQSPATLLFVKQLDVYDTLDLLNQLQVDEIDLSSGGLESLLTLAEMRKVDTEGNFLRIATEDLDGGRYEMHFRRSTTFGGYALTYQWTQFLTRYGLGVGDTVEGWGFRVGPNSELGLKLVVSKHHED